MWLILFLVVTVVTYFVLDIRYQRREYKKEQNNRTVIGAYIYYFPEADEYAIIKAYTDRTWDVETERGEYKLEQLEDFFNKLSPSVYIDKL